MTETEYVLTCIMEEAAELQQVCSKAIRFGLKSCHPQQPGINNIELVARELDDLNAVASILRDMKLLRDPKLPRMVDKIEMVKYWANFSRREGILEQYKKTESTTQHGQTQESKNQSEAERASHHWPGGQRGEDR